MAAYIEINSQYDVTEVAKNISDYRFVDTISVEQFINLFENMNPRNYNLLAYQDILTMVDGEIPDSVIELLVFTDLSYDDFICNAKLKPTMIKKLINNPDLDYNPVGLISYQKLTLPQFKTIVTTTSHIEVGDLAEAIGNAKNPDWAKFVVKSWDELSSVSTFDLNQFKFYMFIGFGPMILSDNDSRKIFGSVRPKMSSEELRSLDPCADGWRRTMKWAGRSETKYSWNEFIARHVLASINSVDATKSDLLWMAESYADEHHLFDM